jgi:hypothetical protein
MACSLPRLELQHPQNSEPDLRAVDRPAECRRGGIDGQWIHKTIDCDAVDFDLRCMNESDPGSKKRKDEPKRRIIKECSGYSVSTNKKICLTGVTFCYDFRASPPSL